MIIMKVNIRLLSVVFRIWLIRSRNGRAALCLAMVTAPGSGLGSGGSRGARH